MAVYTRVDDGALRAFLARYDVGTPLSFKGIAEGVENTNYLVETTRTRAILTLYEKRVDPDDLPFFLRVMSHMAGAGLPAALPIADKTGTILQTLKQKPAALISFVPGISPDDPGEEHCAALGTVLARMHLAMAGFDEERPNALSVDGWHALAARCTDEGLNSIAPGLATTITAMFREIDGAWPRLGSGDLGSDDLPAGVIHGDLFPDNVMLGPDGVITGIIDFYFACTDFYAYDLAICINAWCFDKYYTFSPAAAKSLLRAYQSVRPLLDNEIDHLDLFARGAALRFLLTRAFDWLNQTPGAVVRVKDPGEFLARMEHFAAHPDVLRTLAAQTAVSSPLPTEDKTMLKIYTDGACSGNPGPGGWGVLIMDGTESRTLCGGEPETTNNRMELTAAIEALRTAPNGAQIDLYTDSTYVKDGLNKWMANWKRNGWKTASKKPVKNKDLWIELDTLAAAHTVTWHWVKGHAGDPGNERADELAREGIDKYGR